MRFPVPCALVAALLLAAAAALCPLSAVRAQDAASQDPAAFRAELRSVEAHLAALQAAWDALSAKSGADKQAGMPALPVKLLGAQLDAAPSCRDLYGAALKYEAEACRLYRQLRALDVAKREDLPVAEALKQIRAPAPTRPPFDPQPVPRTKAGAVEKKKAVPDPPDDEALQGTSGAGEAAVAQDVSKLGVVHAVREHVERMAAAAQAVAQASSLQQPGRQDARGMTPAVQAGSCRLDDPLFGPWYVGEPLAHSAQKPNALPADAGGDGVQCWAYLRGWRILGPLPRDVPAVATPLLPPCFDTFVASYPTGEGKTAGTAEWEGIGVEDGTGFVSVPREKGAAAEATTYAATGIWAEKDVETWLAAACAGQLALWLNDRLVVVGSPQKNPDAVEDIVVVPVRLRQGLNRLLLRCDDEGPPPGWWVRVCTRGKPRPAAPGAAQWSALREKVKSLQHLPPNVRQFRGDGTANFADAKPVTAWDWEKGVNILWRVPLDWSKSSPIVVGDPKGGGAGKVFTQIEPHILVCLDKLTGKILWERDSSILELVDKDLYAQSLKMYEEYKQQYAKAHQELFGLGATFPAQVAALVKQGLNPEAAQKQVNDRLQAVLTRQNAWIDFIIKNGNCVKPGWYRASPGGGPWTGFSFATPVSDGKHVWVKYTTGVAACYDLDGNRKWMVKTEYSRGAGAECPSPVLAAGKVILKLPTGGAAKRGQAKAGPEYRLLALDAASGQPAWSVNYDDGPFSTPLVMRLTDGKEEMEVIVDRSGLVVRATDGKVLIKKLHGGESRGSLTAVGDRLYRLGSCYGLHMVEDLFMLDRDTVGAKLIGSHYYTQKVGDCGYAYGSGVLFTLSGRGGHMVNQGFWPVDAENGRHIEWHANLGAPIGRPNMLVSGGSNSVPPTIAGGYAFIGERGAGPRAPDHGFSCVTVMQGCRHGRIVAQNKLEKFLTAHLAFDGDRIYVRSDWFLTCIGYTGDAGRAYEAEENARQLLDELRPEKPLEKPAVAVEPDQQPGGRLKLDLGPIALHEGALALGPFPAAGSDETLTALKAAVKAGLTEKTAITIGGSQSKPVAIGGKAAKTDLQIIKNGRAALNLAKLVSPPAQNVIFLSAVLNSDRKRTLRLLNFTPGVEVWLGGTALQHQDRVTVGAGAYSLLVRAKVNGAPADGLALQVCFADSEDVKAETQEWLDSIRRGKEILERIIQYKPDSDLARKAKACLEQLTP